MAHQIVQQPDGKFAIFSTVVDCFILVDLTEEEVIQHFVDEAAERAVRQARGDLQDLIRCGGRPTWRECLTKHRRHWSGSDHEFNQAVERLAKNLGKKKT